MTLSERFLSYVSYPTMSDETSSTCPSSEKQLALARRLCDDLLAIGLSDARVDMYGYVYASIEKTADDALEAACAQGKISPEMKASWKELILSNPEALTLLAKQPVNPAFSTTYSPQHYADKSSATSPQAILAKHAAIADPEERLDFFRANKAALIAARG